MIDPKYILGLAAFVIMGWFAAGIIYNLRRGDAVLRWMREGLPKIGERTTFRWLGTSVAEMVIAHAHKPFRRMEVMLVLVPRDIAWMWLLARLQGRRDTLILRGQLISAPLFDLEVADPSSWTGRTAVAQAAQRGWESQPYRDMQLFASRGRLNQAAQEIEELIPKIQPLGAKFWRLSLRKEGSQFELHLPFPDLHSPSVDYFIALQELGRAASEQPR